MTLLESERANTSKSIIRNHSQSFKTASARSRSRPLDRSKAGHFFEESDNPEAKNWCNAEIDYTCTMKRKFEPPHLEGLSDQSRCRPGCVGFCHRFVYDITMSLFQLQLIR